MGEATRWNVPRTDEEIAHAADLCRRSGGLTIVGDRGTGRLLLAWEVAQRVNPAATIRALSAHRGDQSIPFSTLGDMGAGEERAAAPASVARRIREAFGPQELTLIIEEADLADSASVRVLASLARTPGTVVIATVTDAGSANVSTLGTEAIVLPQLSSASIRAAITERLGAQPLDRDLRWIEAVSDGSYSSIRWVIETCVRNGAIDIAHGIARISIPDGALTPAWEMEPTLTDTVLGRTIAILGEAPLPLLRRIVGSETIATAEENRSLLIDDASSQACFHNGVIGLDILSRAGRERRRLTVETIITMWDPADDVTARSAANLVLQASELEVDVPSELERLAVPDLVRRGYPDVARKIVVESRAAVAELILADIWTGDPLGAALRFEKHFTTEAVEIDSAFEAASLALVIGELRYGSTSASAKALDEAIALAADYPRVRDTLGAYRSMIRPGATAPDWAALSTADDAQESRARIALAYHALLDGRPTSAANLLAQADGTPPVFAIDDHLTTLLSFLTHLATPDLDAALLALPPRAPHYPDWCGEGALWGFHALLSGNPAAAHQTLEPQLESLRRAFPTVVSTVHATLGFCSLLMGDRLLTQSHFALAQSPSDAPLLEVLRLFAAASATAAIPGGNVDKAWRLLAAVHGAAVRAGMRTLSLAASLGQVFLYRMSFNALTYPHLPSPDFEREHPYEGLFMSYRDVIRAHAEGDFETVAKIALDLHSRGLLIDATGIANTLRDQNGDLPRTVQRAIRRIARRELGAKPVTILADLLTPRELEVARLVADGLTDREIAERLHLSIRTVGVHLGRILRKLGVPTRYQVAAALEPFSLE